jgi:hypothetical protein
MYWRNTKTRDTEVDVTIESGLDYVDDVLVNWKPVGNTTALVVAKRGSIEYEGSLAVTGVGHGIGVLGEFKNNVAKTVSLAVGIEGVIQNNVSGGVITIADCVVAHMNSNVAGATIGTLVLYEATMSGQSGTVTTTVGFHYANHGQTVGAQYAFYNENASAIFLNIGATYLVLPVFLADYTFGTLPSAAAYNTYSAVCNDNGAGNFPVDVRSNGTNWVIKDGLGTLAT